MSRVWLELRGLVGLWLLGWALRVTHPLDKLQIKAIGVAAETICKGLESGDRRRHHG